MSSGLRKAFDSSSFGTGVHKPDSEVGCHQMEAQTRPVRNARALSSVSTGVEWK